LAIARSVVVEMHGETITLESEVGERTRLRAVSRWEPDGVVYPITGEVNRVGLMLDGNAVLPSGGKSQWESWLPVSSSGCVSLR
jgi:hypothetical protein